MQVVSPWVLNFPPCQCPGGSIPTGNVAGVVSSNCPLWEERRGNTTRLPWVVSRKPDEGVLEVEDYRVQCFRCPTHLFGLDFGYTGGRAVRHGQSAGRAKP